MIKVLCVHVCVSVYESEVCTWFCWMLGGLGILLLIGVCFLRYFFSDYQFSNKNCFNKASS